VVLLNAITGLESTSLIEILEESTIPSVGFSNPYAVDCIPTVAIN
jgi:hypothetical protein